MQWRISSVLPRFALLGHSGSTIKARAENNCITLAFGNGLFHKFRGGHAAAGDDRDIIHGSRTADEA
jgi:hypothetical protein